MKIKIELELDIVNGILELLGQMPWKTANPVILDIREQIRVQSEPPADPPPP